MTQKKKRNILADSFICEIFLIFRVKFLLYANIFDQFMVYVAEYIILD